MNREWRTDNAHVGQLVALSAKDNNRLGIVWMKGRILDGDLAMVVSHAGDCYWQYKLINHGAWLCGKSRGAYENRIGFQLIDGSEFGAYTIGEPYQYQLTAREIHLLLAGECIPLDADPRRPSWLK